MDSSDADAPPMKTAKSDHLRFAPDMSARRVCSEMNSTLKEQIHLDFLKNATSHSRARNCGLG
jgi:hypothetical protein